jgi:hypothetical protein
MDEKEINGLINSGILTALDMPCCENGSFKVKKVDFK